MIPAMAAEDATGTPKYHFQSSAPVARSRAYRYPSRDPIHTTLSAMAGVADVPGAHFLASTIL
jgi:hypothetical protein